MLEFNKNKTRLLLTRERGKHIQPSAALMPIGAVRNKDGYSYPVEELVIPYVKHYIPGITFSNAVVSWYENVKKESVKRHALGSIKNKDIPALNFNNKKIDGAIKDYQITAVNFFNNTKRCIIRYDMGLGKTLIALSIIENNKFNTSLIVSPGYVKINWQEEVKKWTDIKAFAAVGTKTKRTKILKEFEEYQGRKILIVNYEMLRPKKGYKEIFKYKFDFLVLDEAHRLKSRITQKDKENETDKYVLGVKQLQIKNIAMLTATPISKCESEIWQLLNILDSKRFRSYWQFVNFMMNVSEDFFGVKIDGIKRKNEYTYIKDTYLISRMKEDVIDLPEKIENEIYIELPDVQRKGYKDILDFYIQPDNTIIKSDLEKTIRAFEYLANNALVGGKNRSIIFNTVFDMLKDIDGKCIIAFNSKKAAALFSEISNFPVITGSVSIERRYNILEDFKKDTQYIITTIKALSEGVNIDYCDTVIFTDWTYNSMTNEQFKNRIHRMTTTRVKNYYHIIIKDTIHEIKYNLLKREFMQMSESMNDSSRNVKFKVSDNTMIMLIHDLYKKGGIL